ncbi:MAG: Dabb family protein [Paludibacteraceae bacterium]|nr:Dabb family protein [Paludibacteraceae bacterium]
MIKHIVMWKFKDFANGKSKLENAMEMKSKLESLVGEIDVLRSLEVGINNINSESSYDMVLTTTFDNENNMKSYAKHPSHLKVSEFCKSIRISRVCVDYYF